MWYRIHENGAGMNWQFGIADAVFAQFGLERPSSDLINADYVIGLPLAWRRDDWSGRMRLYHQSSHLGDEFLLNTQPQRVNLSFEAIEAIIAHDFGGLRMYGGGEYLIDRDPRDLGAGTSLLFDWAIWAARALGPRCWSSMTALRPMGSSTRWMCAIGGRPLSWPTDIARELQ
ncbi:MAG: DUF1207 domain-containing protein [Steroidobacteraceae bacterium]